MPAFMVVSRSSSSASDWQVNRTMSAGSGRDRPPAWELTIPDVRPMRSTAQFLPCSSLNVRMDVDEPVAEAGCQSEIARVIYGHLGPDAISSAIWRTWPAGWGYGLFFVQFRVGSSPHCKVRVGV